jgi:hypothetical protein
MALLILLLAAALPACAQTEPKASAGEYPVHAMAGNLAIGAEYMVHSFSGGGQTFIAQDYLIVEVALYPAKGEPLMVNADQFRLRLNNKDVVAPRAPQFVVASLDTSYVGMDGSQNSQRFPGDPANRPHTPVGPDGQPLPTPDELVVRIALPEAEARKPVSGYLYFPHKGKTSKIHSLQLDYTGPAGNATLSLD